MSVSGQRVTVDINLDEFERRLRAAGAQHPGMEDPLSELARLVEASMPVPPASANPTPAARTEPPVKAEPHGHAVPAPAVDAALRPSLDAEDAYEGEFEPESDTAPAGEPDEFAPNHESGAGATPVRRSGAWKLTVSALALAGVAMIGGVFALKRGVVPGLPTQPPFIAAAQGPTKVQPPSEETVSNPNDSGSLLLKDSNAPSPHVKVVTSEEQPVDLQATAAVAAAKAPPADAPTDLGIKAPVETPVVVASTASPPPVASQFPDPKPVRTVSLRPDGTPIASAAPSDAPAAAPAPAAAAPAEPPKPPAKPPRKAASEAASAQASTPKLELPTKLSGKSSARVVVAKTDTTAPDTNEPIAPGASAKSEKPAKATKTQQAAAEPERPAAGEPAQATAATSAGWAVQLGAPKSEAEAKSELARLNAKYASALNGETLGIHKAVLHGNAIYRLRVVGLSNKDAAALCARLKGDGGDCFIAK